MNKRLGILVLVLVIGVGLCGLVVLGGAKLFSGVLSTAQGVGDSANNFMVALRDKKLDDAYGMLSSDLQEQQSRANFKEALTGSSFKDWTFNHFSVKNDTGYVEGTATDTEGNHYVAFEMVSRNNQWAISGYNLGTLGWVGTVGDPSS